MMRPQRNENSSLRGSMAGTPLKPIGESPINSITVDMVFAVYCPPQAPAPGHATFSNSSSSASVISPAAFAPTSFFFQAEDGIRDLYVTGVQTCALPIYADIAVEQVNQIHGLVVVFVFCPVVTGDFSR